MRHIPLDIHFFIFYSRTNLAFMVKWDEKPEPTLILEKKHFKCTHRYTRQAKSQFSHL